MNMKKTILAVSMLLVFLSCKKQSGDGEKPSITVTSPTANQQFTPGQVVTISANISDNDLLYEVHLYVTNKANGAEVVHQMQRVDMKTYALSNTFTAGGGITYLLRVTAMDRSGNLAESSLEVKGL